MSTRGPSAAYAWMPCRAHGGIGDSVHCHQCQPIAPPLPPPPGETGRELTGIDAIALFDSALKGITESPRMAIKGVKDIDVRKVGSWVIITVKFTGQKGGANEVTFRMRRAWGDVLRNRLARVLD